MTHAERMTRIMRQLTSMVVCYNTNVLSGADNNRIKWAYDSLMGAVCMTQAIDYHVTLFYPRGEHHWIRRISLQRMNEYGEVLDTMDALLDKSGKVIGKEAEA